MEFNKIFNYGKKVQEFLEFINFIISVPFYIIYDNLNYYFNLDKYTKQYELLSSNKLELPCMSELNELDNYSDDDYLTDDHYKRCIYPMEQMALYFVEVLRQNNKIESEFSKNERFDLINRVKVGSYKGINGNDKGIFNKNLSGST